MTKNLNNLQHVLKDGDVNYNFTTEASRNLYSEFDSAKLETKFIKTDRTEANDITFAKGQLNPDDLRLNSNSEGEIKAKTNGKIDSAYEVLKTKQNEF